MPNGFAFLLGGCVKTIIENDKTIKFKHVVEIRLRYIC